MLCSATLLQHIRDNGISFFDIKMMKFPQMPSFFFFPPIIGHVEGMLIIQPKLFLYIHLRWKFFLAIFDKKNFFFVSFKVTNKVYVILNSNVSLLYLFYHKNDLTWGQGELLIDLYIKISHSAVLSSYVYVFFDKGLIKKTYPLCGWWSWWWCWRALHSALHFRSEIGLADDNAIWKVSKVKMW